MDLDVHLAAIADGDAQAFAAWLAGAELPVRRSLRSFASVVDTEAVLQEALLRTWQVAPKVRRDGKPNSLLRVSMRIARNTAIDEVRRARVEPVEPHDLERQLQHDPRPMLPDPGLRDAIARCLAKLPPQPGKAIGARLRASGGVSDTDLAAQVGMRLNTFLKNVGRARHLLVECLAAVHVVLEVP